MQTTKRAVINYLINYQGFGSGKSLEETLDYHGCIQIDPISVVAKTHEMSLFWRDNRYKQEDLDNLVYKKRGAFEYWMQRYSIIPNGYWNYFDVVRKYKRPWTVEFEKKHEKEIKSVVDFIKKNGATCAGDLMHIPKGLGFHSWKYVENHTGYLQYLWEMGEVVVCKREKNRKYYDLSEKFFLPQKKLNEQEVEDFFLEKAFAYSGIASLWWLGQTRFAKILNLKKYLKSKKVVNLDIEGNKKYFILESEVDNFLKISKNLKLDETIILPPLDPMIMDRDMIEFLFGYKYRWNVYTKAEKRRGFYNMLILENGEIKSEIALLRKDKKLEIEDGNYKMTRELVNAIGKLEEFCLN